MEQRRFGNTDLTTSPIGFGTWEISGTMYGEIDAAAAGRAVGAAIDHGITLFDTAAVYGPFHSERLLAKALGARRREVTLVTKVCEVYRIFAAERVPTYAGTPVTVRPDQQILFQGDD